MFKSNDNATTFAELSVQVGGTEVDISSKEGIIEFIFDQTLPMQSHMNASAKRLFCYLKNILKHAASFRMRNAR